MQGPCSDAGPMLGAQGRNVLRSVARVAITPEALRRASKGQPEALPMVLHALHTLTVLQRSRFALNASFVHFGWGG